MSQPSPYTRGYSFTDFSSGSPSSQPPGTKLDAEFDGIAATLAELLVNLALVQRDDAALRNGIVGIDQLSSQALALIGSEGFTVRGQWAAASAYVLGDIASNAGVVYLCLAAHTSSALAADVAASNLVAIFDPGNNELRTELALATGLSGIGATGGITAQAALNLKANISTLALATGLASIGAVGGITAQAAVDLKASTATLAGVAGIDGIGLNRTGVGVVPRTARDLLRMVPFAPEDFGAVGDGVADDTAPIQKAITAAAAFPPSVVLLTQTYKTTGVIIGASGVTMMWTDAAHLYANLNGGSTPAVWGKSRFNIINAAITVISTGTPGIQSGIHAPILYGALYNDANYPNTVAAPSQFNDPGHFEVTARYLVSDKYVEIPNQAALTASITATTMTVTAVANGTVFVGDTVRGAGVTAGTKVTAYVSGTGGTGTYTVSASQTVASSALTLSSFGGSSAVAIVGGHDFYVHDVYVPSNATMAGTVMFDWGEIGGLASSETLINMNANKAKWLAGTAYQVYPRNGLVERIRFGALSAPAGGRTDTGSFGVRGSGGINMTVQDVLGESVTYIGAVYTTGDLGEEFAPLAHRGLVNKGIRFDNIRFTGTMLAPAASSDSHGDNVARAILNGYTAMTTPTTETDIHWSRIQGRGDGTAASPIGFRIGDQNGGTVSDIDITGYSLPVYITDGAKLVRVVRPRVSAGRLDGITVDGATTPPEDITIEDPICFGNGLAVGDYSGVHFASSKRCRLLGGKLGKPGEATQKFGYRLGASAAEATVIGTEVEAYSAGGAASYIQRSDALISTRELVRAPNTPFVLAQAAVAIPFTGSVAETTLVTITIPAGAIGPNGRVVVHTIWSATANGNSKVGRIRLDGNLLAVVTPSSDATCAGDMTFYNRNSAASQMAFAMGTAFASGSGIQTSTVNTAAASTLTITADLDVGTDSFNLEAYTVTIDPRP